MKKKKLLVLSAVCCCAAAVALAGCQEALVSSEVKMEKTGAGTKTITAVIFGDNSPQAGVPEGTENPPMTGNNSKFLLVSGTALENKIKSYSALDGIEVKAKEETNGNTTLTLTYSFTSIADYNTKTKTLAKDDASDIEDATWTENADGTYTYKENCDNTEYSVMNIFSSLYNDPEAFAKSADGIDLDGQGGYTAIYKIMSVSATVGDKTEKVDIREYRYNADGNNVSAIELDYPDYLEVTGKFVDAPTEDKKEEKSGCGSSIGMGAIGLSALAVATLGVVVTAVVISKKKKS